MRWTKKIKFGGTIGYGHSYLQYIICHSKAFRLRALHNAAGAKRSHTGKSPGYCYMIGRGPNSCLLGYVTGLLFCLYVKLFLPCIFNSGDFRISMSCIVLDIELAKKRYQGNWSFYWWECSGTLISSSKKSTNPHSKRFAVQETCTELCETVEVWVTVSLQTFFLQLWRVDTAVKGERRGKFGRSRLSQSSRSLRWRSLDLLELPIQTQDHTSLCRAWSKFVYNATSNVVKFVIWNVLSLSTKINLSNRFNLYLRDWLLRNWAYKTDDWSRRCYQSK